MAYNAVTEVTREQFEKQSYVLWWVLAGVLIATAAGIVLTFT